MNLDDLFMVCLFNIKNILELRNKNDFLNFNQINIELKELMMFSHILIFAVDNHFGRLANSEISEFIDYMLDKTEKIRSIL